MYLFDCIYLKNLSKKKRFQAGAEQKRRASKGRERGREQKEDMAVVRIFANTMKEAIMLWRPYQEKDHKSLSLTSSPQPCHHCLTTPQ